MNILQAILTCLDLDPGPRTSGRPPIDYLIERLPEATRCLELVGLAYVEFATFWAEMGLMARAIAQRADEAFPSEAYAPLLIEHGVQPVVARGLASIAISRGTRIANESRRLPAVVAAIRSLANPLCSRRTMNRSAALMLAAWEETSIVETIFDDAGIRVFEFIDLLERVVKGDGVHSRRIIEIATTIAPVLSIPRGPKISAASAAHEFVLDELEPVFRRQAFTWNPLKDDYSDPLTLAARKEFKDPEFDPQPARRRIKARRKAAAQPKPQQQDAAQSGSTRFRKKPN